MNIYVASPYQIPKGVPELWEEWSDRDRADLIQWRTDTVLQETAILQYSAWQVALPYFLYTPIGYESVLIDQVKDGLTTENRTNYRADGEYWMKVDRSIFGAMDQIVIIGMPGWTRSSGVLEEAKHFADKGCDVLLLLPGNRYNANAPTAVKNMNEILAEADIDFKYVKDENAFWDVADIIDTLETFE
jgi:hypothetical protein